MRISKALGLEPLRLADACYGRWYEPQQGGGDGSTGNPIRPGGGCGLLPGTFVEALTCRTEGGADKLFHPVFLPFFDTRGQYELADCYQRLRIHRARFLK